MHKVLIFLFLCFSGLAQCQTTFNQLFEIDSSQTGGSFFVLETDTNYLASFVQQIPDGFNNIELGFLDIGYNGSVVVKSVIENDSINHFSPSHHQVDQRNNGFFFSNTINNPINLENANNFLSFTPDFSLISDTIYSLGDTISEQLRAHAFVNDSIFYAVGYSEKLTEQGDFLIQKMNIDGDILNFKVIPDSEYQFYKGVEFDSGANALYAIGLKETPRNGPGQGIDRQYWITKFDTALNEIWHLSVPEECDETNRMDMTLGPDGSLFFVAGVCTDNLPYYGLKLIKISPEGLILWEDMIEYPELGQKAKKVFLHDNHLFVLSHLFKRFENDTISGQYFSGFYKLDLSGNKIWSRLIRHTVLNNANSELEDIIPTSDGGFIGVGQFKRSLQQPSAWVVKLNSEGCFDHEECIDYTSVPTVEDPVQEPKIFPNPFKNELNFEIKNCKSIAIYNNHGQRVFNQPRLKSINTSNWAPGLYVYYATLNSGQVIQGKCIKY